MLELNRRQFLQATGGGALGLASFGFDGEAAIHEVRATKIELANETRTVCPYCAVGCSMLAYTIGGDALNTQPVLVHIEGDPDSPVNGGTLCPKGAATVQLAVNDRRPMYPMYRAPGASEWERISWDEAMSKFTRWAKDSRENNFVEIDDEGNTVNRNTGFAFLGGATISSEEGYLTAKLMRALGVVYLEQQARV
jgi:formate dehydrogenase major subunit